LGGDKGTDQPMIVVGKPLERRGGLEILLVKFGDESEIPAHEPLPEHRAFLAVTRFSELFSLA
jgi:hypothetical protein